MRRLSERVCQGCVVSTGSKISNTVLSICRQEFFSWVPTEGGTPWDFSFFSFLHSTCQGSRHVLRQNLHTGAQSWNDLHHDQGREQQVLPFGNGEPILCSDQRFQDFEPFSIDAHTKVSHPSSRQCWLFQGMLLLSARQRVSSNVTSELSHQRPQSNHVFSNVHAGVLHSLSRLRW